MEIREHARTRPDALALSFEGRRWTWRDLEAEVASWSQRLQAQGVGRGTRVGVLSRNRPEVVFLLHAIGRLDATLVALNARLGSSELAPHVKRARPFVVFAEPSLEERIPGAITFDPGETRSGQSSKDESPSTAAPLREDLAPGERIGEVLLFTSGTTGIAKCARLSRGGIAAHIRASEDILGHSANARWLGCLPLFHIGGLMMALRCAAHGSALLLQDGFRTDAVVDALAHEGVTHLSVVPTALGWLLEHPSLPETTALQAVLVGGGPATPTQLAAARARGLPVLQTYGLTEACSQVCTERPGEADGLSAGPPLPGIEVRVVDPEGRLAPEGEVQVLSPAVMIGYLDDPDATGTALADGWLRTGDFGWLDDQGRLHLLGRRHDLVVSGGENIYPAEIEGVLLTHPGLVDAAVVGIEDATWGQVPVALLTPRVSVALPGDLDAWCRSRLAGFKVPRRFVQVPSLPRTASGKLERAALPALAATHLSR